MRSVTGIKSALFSDVVLVTKSIMDCFELPSFQDESGAEVLIFVFSFEESFGCIVWQPFTSNIIAVAMMAVFVIFFIVKMTYFKKERPAKGSAGR